ncbi:MAG: hypothetical protein IJ437_01435 [Clostridia bacterium]|nr:hypothetical protein [Clostridia bacterium]
MKKLLSFLKSPPIWFMAIVWVLTIIFCALSLVVVCLGFTGEWTYVAYAFAATTLAYSVYSIVKFAPKIKRSIIDALRSRAFTKRLLEEYGFRSVVIAVFSLSINIAYTIFNTVISIVASSLWFGAISMYHAILILMRSDTLLSRHKKPRASYVRCAILLIFLSLFLSLAVWQMISNDLAFVRFGWTVYAYAAFAFYKIITSIINLFKSRNEAFTIKAIKYIGFADALVSILTLQTSLLYAFSDGSYGFANAITGAVVCGLTLLIGIFMLVEARRKNERRK